MSSGACRSGVVAPEKLFPRDRASYASESRASVKSFASKALSFTASEVDSSWGISAPETHGVGIESSGDTA
jgi:hypothetical protein